MKKPLDWCSGLSPSGNVSKNGRWILTNNARLNWPKMHKFWEKMPEEGFGLEEDCFAQLHFPFCWFDVERTRFETGLAVRSLSGRHCSLASASTRPRCPLLLQASAAAPASHVCCCRVWFQRAMMKLKGLDRALALQNVALLMVRGKGWSLGFSFAGAPTGRQKAPLGSFRHPIATSDNLKSGIWSRVEEDCIGGAHKRSTSEQSTTRTTWSTFTNIWGFEFWQTTTIVKNIAIV